MTLAALPHFEFLDDSSLLVNCLFAGFLGGSIGTILYATLQEIIKYLKD
jgi:hypothetical protein